MSPSLVSVILYVERPVGLGEWGWDGAKERSQVNVNHLSYDLYLVNFTAFVNAFAT